MTETHKGQGLFSKNPYFSDQWQPLKPLPHSIYFVTKEPKWQDLINNPNFQLTDSLYERCTTGHDIWSAQVYLDLKRRGLDVHLVSQPVPGQICVIPHYYLLPRDLLFKSYVVACQHDTPCSKLCNQRIVINRLQVTDQNCHFLPHRPQPNLKPRNSLRGTTIRNLVFKGHSYNLYDSFRSPEFLEELKALGITLVMSTEASDLHFTSWADYTEADVVIAVRNSTRYDAALKPALKLINAWFAGCPAILGPEPAYQELRQSALDYIEVQTPQQAIAALKHLQENPDIYLAMIENGFRRAHEFTADAIALQWRNLLAGSISKGYEHWLGQSMIQKYAIRPAQYVQQVFSHRKAYQEYLNSIHHGSRILSDAGEQGLILSTETDVVQKIGI